MVTPKMDEEVKEQLKQKGEDAFFGSEKTLYRVQEQLLDTAGPLICLWADLLNKDAMVSKEDIVMLVQRALVLLGSASNTITLERRKIAWSRFNPKLKSLASEEYEKRKISSGFLEKASKQIEASKTLKKVSYNPSRPLPKKRARFDNDKDDLRHFFVQGCSDAVRQSEKTSTSSRTLPIPSSSLADCIEYETGQHPRTRHPPSKASQASEPPSSCEFSEQQACRQ